MAQEFGGRVRFSVENYGDSRLAKAAGVTRYPAIFVDDVLVATPKDFGFYGKGEGADGGRYAPLRSAASQERFRSDLRRMIDLVLAGKRSAAKALAPSPRGGEPSRLPDVTLTDVGGRKLSRADLHGRPVLVEIWATWCPPCRATLRWLGTLKKEHGDRLSILTLAVESDQEAVRKVANDLDLPLLWAMGTPEVVKAFGDVAAVPTLLLFDGRGEAAGAFYGAPPGLHSQVESALRGLMARRQPRAEP